MTRVCERCGKELPISEFRKFGRGYMKVCKDCEEKAVEKEAAVVREAISEKLYDEPEFISHLDQEDEPEAKAYVHTLMDHDDAELVNELRARGWEVTCKRTMIVEL